MAICINSYVTMFLLGNRSIVSMDNGFIYPLVMTNKAIEHGHRNSGFTQNGDFP